MKNNKRMLLAVLAVAAALGIGGVYIWRQVDEQQRISAYVAALDRLALVLEENAAKREDERDVAQLRQAVAKCKQLSANFEHLSPEELSAALERNPELDRATQRVKRGMAAVQRGGPR